MTDRHPNVLRVLEAGAARGLTIEPRTFPEGTKTALDAATAIGVDVGQIVKSLIFAVDGEVVLAYVSGSNQLDEKKLAAAAGGAQCARVDADTGEFAGVFTAIQPSDTDMGSKDPQDVKITGDLYGRLEKA